MVSRRTMSRSSGVRVAPSLQWNPQMFNLRMVAFSFLLTASSLFAQSLVTVSCDKGSSASCTYTDANGTRTDIVVDRNQNGEVEFTVPDGVTQVMVSKYSDGRWITYRVNLDN